MTSQFASHGMLYNATGKVEVQTVEQSSCFFRSIAQVIAKNLSASPLKAHYDTMKPWLIARQQMNILGTLTGLQYWLWYELVEEDQTALLSPDHFQYPGIKCGHCGWNRCMLPSGAIP